MDPSLLPPGWDSDLFEEVGTHNLPVEKKLDRADLGDLLLLWERNSQHDSRKEPGQPFSSSSSFTVGENSPPQTPNPCPLIDLLLVLALWKNSPLLPLGLAGILQHPLLAKPKSAGKKWMSIGSNSSNYIAGKGMMDLELRGNKLITSSYPVSWL